MTYQNSMTLDEAPAVEPERWSQGWRRFSLSAGMLIYPVVTAVGVSQYSHSPDSVAAGYLIVAVFALCYILATLSAMQLAWRRFWTLIGIMTALFVSALPFAHEQAFFLSAVVVSVITNFKGRRAAPIVIAAVLASIFVPWAIRPWHSGPGLLQPVTIVFTVLIVYAFSETVKANHALIEARAEVARLASDAERARIARDLHDLLGHSLTAITVKSDLARRLAMAGSDRSLQEISEVEKLSRQALADVRAAVSGYRDVTVAGELARGKELLRASGVTADLPTATEMVDSAHQELFGWAVREGVTNVARHAKATRCTVLLSATEVEIRDDGVGGSSSSGNGLAGLRERAAALGGTVEAGPLSPRGWRLRVSIDSKAAMT